MTTAAEPLKHKQIVLGVSGGIAAYKSAELVRELIRAGARVKVMMTKAASAFVTPLTLHTLSGHRVYDHQWLSDTDQAMEHIDLARWADVILIAPATADCIARLAQGQANDIVTTTCLATNAPIMIAPAMNQQMWQHPAVQANCQRLQQYHYQIIPPAIGEQACGDVGPGRLPEPHELVTAVEQFFLNNNTTTAVYPTAENNLQQRHILITAGPTHEALDPVRYLSSRSSGKMGYALAQAAANAGAQVTLVSGPSHLTPPKYINCINVTSAEEMLAAVMQHAAQADVFISAAAIADYRPQTITTQKIKKQQQPLQLTLTRNPDILMQVAKLNKDQRPFLVGFAAETENIIANAKLKLQRKQLDLIVANSVSNHQGFAVDNNTATIIDSNENEYPLNNMPKYALADIILNMISEQLPTKTVLC